MTNPLLRAALAFAGRGYPVFPLHSVFALASGQHVCTCGTSRCRNPAKHPIGHLVPKGLLNATTDEPTIREWWRLVPDANIGLATGAVLVLDVDPRHGGDAALAEVQRRQGAMPSTWRALTGGGGEHIYFATQSEIRNSTGKLGPGLDIRGAGGYVVAPPSVHISGRPYAWSVDDHPDDVLLAQVPPWMVKALGEPTCRASRPACEWRDLVNEGVSNGRRNDAVARLTGHLLRRYVDPEVAHELVQAWNAARCRPPLDPDEVTRTVGSIAKKELDRREAANAERR